jgi:hypothetical protein
LFVAERFERLWGWGPGGGSFASLRMTARTNNRKNNGKNKSNHKNKDRSRSSACGEG